MSTPQELKEQLGLSDDQIAEYKEAFALFDKKGHGTINVKDIGGIMRGLGQNASDEELLAIVADVDTDGTGDLDFPQFLTLMASKMKLTNADEEVKEAFQLFNKGNAFAVDEMKKIMAALGEKLTDEEIQEMITEADQDKDGKINFDEFNKMMTTGSA